MRELDSFLSSGSTRSSETHHPAVAMLPAAASGSSLPDSPCMPGVQSCCLDGCRDAAMYRACVRVCAYTSVCVLEHLQRGCGGMCGPRREGKQCLSRTRSRPGHKGNGEHSVCASWERVCRMHQTLHTSSHHLGATTRLVSLSGLASTAPRQRPLVSMPLPGSVLQRVAASPNASTLMRRGVDGRGVGPTRTALLEHGSRLELWSSLSQWGRGGGGAGQWRAKASPAATLPVTAGPSQSRDSGTGGHPHGCTASHTPQLRVSSRPPQTPTCVRHVTGCVPVLQTASKEGASLNSRHPTAGTQTRDIEPRGSSCEPHSKPCAPVIRSNPSSP